MTTIKEKMINTLGFLKKAARRQPQPIHPDPELPTKLPTEEQLATIDKKRTTQGSPFIALWPGDQQRPSDADREAPYVTRGRYAEINHLLELLEAPPRAIHLITGPPGSGKSTLLETMVEYATRRGFLPVKILPETFLDPTTVIEEIRRQTLGAALAGSRVDIELHQNVTDETRFGGSVGIFDGDHKRTFDDGKREQRSEQGSPQLLRHLQEIVAVLHDQYKHIRGILIYCDEFQELHELSRKTAKERRLLRPQFYTLNEQLRKHKPPLPILTLLAGIPPAHQTLQNLLSRKSITTTIELLPVDGYPIHDPRSPHCTLILHDHLRASRAALGHQFHIPIALLHIWGMECRGHVLHANHAGATIQNQLEIIHDSGTTALTTEDYKNIDKAIQTRQREYYKDCFNSIFTNMPLDISKQDIRNVTEHLIAAMETQMPSLNSTEQPYFLTWDTLQEVAAAAMQTPNEEQANAILEHLQNKGVINCMNDDGRFLHYDSAGIDYDAPDDSNEIQPDSEEYGDCLIPTLSRHIRSKTRTKKREQIQSTVRKVIQNEGNLARTQWHWREKVPMRKISKIPKVDYAPPVFPHVFTPLQATTETVELITEIRNDPDAQDPFIQQRVEYLHNQLRHKLQAVNAIHLIEPQASHDTGDVPIKHET